MPKKAKKRGTIYLWTGTGAGKTTSSLGVALRSVGHKKKVIIIQFLKGRKDIGEYKIMERLKPYYEVHQFGRVGWVDLHNPSKIDIELARKGLKFAAECLKRKPHLLVLDELALAVAFKLVPLNEVLKILKNVPPKTTVYITGRFAPKGLIRAADYVTEFVTLKMPKKIVARKGIEY
ncbi:MAG: cob(I)yrinic acid a,c-diamide adenosyltransferase [Candidatus Woesearchaeota archaeon]